MLKGIIDNVRRERAMFVRDVAYLKEMAEDDIISDRIEKAEGLFIKETAEDIKEAVDLVNYMPDEFEAEENAEIEKILNSEENMTFDQMIGITE